MAQLNRRVANTEKFPSVDEHLWTCDPDELMLTVRIEVERAGSTGD
jgi:hypothetical protein